MDKRLTLHLVPFLIIYLYNVQVAVHGQDRGRRTFLLSLLFRSHAACLSSEPQNSHSFLKDFPIKRFQNLPRIKILKF